MISFFFVHSVSNFVTLAAKLGIFSLQPKVELQENITKPNDVVLWGKAT